MAVPKGATKPTLNINFPGINTPLLSPEGGPAAPWYLAFLGYFNRTGGPTGIDGAQLVIDDANQQFLTGMSPKVHGDSAPLPYNVAIGVSPAVVQAPFRGYVNVQGGTVSAVDLSRDGGANYFTISGGLVPVFTGDFVQITYTVLPTVTMIGF